VNEAERIMELECEVRLLREILLTMARGVPGARSAILATAKSCSTNGSLNVSAEDVQMEAVAKRYLDGIPANLG
jgi:hypothetical protein